MLSVVYRSVNVRPGLVEGPVTYLPSGRERKKHVGVDISATWMKASQMLELISVHSVAQQVWKQDCLAPREEHQLCGRSLHHGRRHVTLPFWICLLPTPAEDLSFRYCASWKSKYPYSFLSAAGVTGYTPFQVIPSLWVLASASFPLSTYVSSASQTVFINWLESGYIFHS
jgi:hypothetical protein